MVLTDGQVLDGKYVIDRVLATGSMGEIYLGRNKRIGKEVAVKVLRRDLADTPAIASRFEREALIATAVKSSHVVDVYDLGELASGERFIVMEYVEGESLATRIEREGKVPERDVVRIALQILDGLVAAHAAGVIHRDLKPDNIILTKRDDQELVKLVDFGISKMSATPDAPATATTKTRTLHGMLLGTPMYMSPEQARGEADIDARTDIFSLGVTMYEALAGDVPFTADNVVALLSKVIDDEETPLTDRVAGLDPALARMVQKAMAKDPADRFQTAAEMRAALAEWHAMFGSLSVMRSSIDGVVTRPVAERLPFAMPSWIRIPPVALPILKAAANDKRVRTAAVAATIAALITSIVVRGGGAAAEATTASAPVVTATAYEPGRIVVPTVPVTGDPWVYGVPVAAEVPASTATTTAATPTPVRALPAFVAKAPAAPRATATPKPTRTTTMVATTATTATTPTTATAAAAAAPTAPPTATVAAATSASAAAAKPEEPSKPISTIAPPPDPPATP